jgi:hypothetical protein
MYKTYNAMKNILHNIKTDPRLQLGLGGLFFFIASVDTWGFGANSWGEMLWWSKTAMVGFAIIFLMLLFRFLLMPLGYAIFNGIKKIFKK